MKQTVAMVVGLVVLAALIASVFIFRPKSGTEKIIEAFGKHKIDYRAIDEALEQGEKLERQIRDEQARIDAQKKQFRESLSNFEDEALGW